MRERPHVEQADRRPQGESAEKSRVALLAEQSDAYADKCEKHQGPDGGGERSEQGCEQRAISTVAPECAQAESDRERFGPAQKRQLYPGEICEREIGAYPGTEQTGHQEGTNHRRRDRHEPEAGDEGNMQNQRDRGDRIRVAHKVLDVELVKIPIPDCRRDAQVRGVVPVTEESAMPAMEGN